MFFSKSFDDIDLCETLWLSSIIPAPVANHDYFLKGEISPNSKKRMKENFSRLIVWKKIEKEGKFDCKDLEERIAERGKLIQKKKSL